jgi:arylsulfatase A-like enzyme
MFKPSMNYHRGFNVWHWIRGQEADRFETSFRKDLEIEDMKYLPCELAYGCVGHSLHYCLPNMQNWRTEADWFPARTFGRAIDWLQANQDCENFLLVVDEFDPHEPWNAPKDLLDLYFDTASYQGRRIINTRGGPFTFQEDELDYTFAQYAGEVTLCDKYVGKLLDTVKELGKWEDTVVIVVSDHGHNIMDHGVMHKVPSHLYPELMDLVFIVRHPAEDYVGTICDAFVGHHDLLPTLLSLTDLSSPQHLDGRNIWKWVTGEERDQRAYVTSIFGEWVWCRDKEYAFISDFDGENTKLYDVQTDPEQRIDVADRESTVCQKMYKRILNDAGTPLPHYEIRRKGHSWYEYPDVYAPSARVPSIDHHKSLK